MHLFGLFICAQALHTTKLNPPTTLHSFQDLLSIRGGLGLTTEALSAEKVQLFQVADEGKAASQA